MDDEGKGRTDKSNQCKQKRLKTESEIRKLHDIKKKNPFWRCEMENFSF